MIKSLGVPSRYLLVQNDRRAVCDETQAYFGLTSYNERGTSDNEIFSIIEDRTGNSGLAQQAAPVLISFEAERFFLIADFKLISFAAYN